ncbi:MAG: acetylornithine transaminase [Deltaproteobacteria bacterium]|nr:acetylornithine transaminase [Candidatus Anaeroferrophillus wilburensis]MBN2888682.1 acetylornithine transaminase [Deltaproteobacteria bacterium]
MNSQEIFTLSDAHVAPTYRRYPVALVRGRGMKLWDADGREYLDFLAGIAVCNLGHCHSLVTHAIAEQAKRLLHVSNLYYIEPQASLAAELCCKSFAQKVFFCNSGAEANEAAIKLARRYGHEVRGVAEGEIITMQRSFHGRTMATLSATGQEKIQLGYQPLLTGFTYVPFDDPQAVVRAITSKTCAVMVEPVQGEGGVVVPRPGYLQELRRICDDHGLLLILDEVQTGLGRTGRLFAHQHSGMTPDIMTLAKALGAGFPIGAMLATDKVANIFGPGSHASTFGGNPLACSAALASLKAIDTDDILANCQRQGVYLTGRLETLRERHACIKEIRGLGLMVGVDLGVPVGDIIQRCLERGILVGPAGEQTLRLTPPLIVTEADIETLMTVLDEVLP